MWGRALANLSELKYDTEPSIAQMPVKGLSRSFSGRWVVIRSISHLTADRGTVRTIPIRCPSDKLSKSFWPTSINGQTNWTSAMFSTLKSISTAIGAKVVS